MAKYSGAGGWEIPEENAAGVAVVRITIESMTGKACGRGETEGVEES